MMLLLLSCCIVLYCCHLVVRLLLGLRYPIYGSQWHPEKNLFEWSYEEGMDHSAVGIAPIQYIADFFVNEVRVMQCNVTTGEIE